MRMVPACLRTLAAGAALAWAASSAVLAAAPAAPGKDDKAVNAPETRRAALD